MDRELRRILFIAAGIVVALFTGRAVIGALWDEDGTVRQVNSMRAKLRSGGEAAARPSRSEMDRMARLRAELTERLDAALERVDYALPEDFALRSGDSPDLRYVEIVRREQDRLVKGAAFVGKSVPSNLGLPDLNPTGREDVLRTLRSLHVVHVAVMAALAADIDAVDEIRLPVAGRRRVVETGFLRDHSVEFAVRGSSAAVRDMLTDIVEGEPYLALDEVRIENLDEDGERVSCRFTVRGLDLDPEQDVLTGGRS